MSIQVTVTLEDDILRRAEWWANRAGLSVSDVLAGTIEASLRPLGPDGDARPVTTWSNDEVLSAADVKLAEGDDQRLSALLDRQQAGLISDGERAELQALMLLYQQGLLKKAQALREAVRRKLSPPLAP